MNCLPLLFSLVSSVMGSIPWYPVMVPIHTGGHHHRHTTHVVTHPIIHTRLLVLGDDDHHHHHKHNHGHNHLHKHGHDHKHDHRHQHLQHQSASHQYQQHQVHRRPKVHGVQHSSRNKQAAHVRYYDDYHRDEDGYSQEGHGYDDHDGNRYSDHDPIKYSVLVSDSPWKPIHQYPKGYVPLKYLGIDEERVAAVVKEALHDMENDMNSKQKFISSVGSRNYYKQPLNSPNSLHRGAVYYDKKHEDTYPRYGAGSYDYKNHQSSTTNPKTFKLNIECQCEDQDD